MRSKRLSLVYFLFAIVRIKFVDKNNILVYIIVKLTCEGARLGSRMGVGYNLRNPKPLGSAYFFNESLNP